MMLKNNKKQKILLLSLVVLLLISTGSVIAFLTASSQDVNNKFTPSNVSCEVNEQFVADGDEILKSDVTIENTGKANAFIRAEVVVTWKKKVQNDDGSTTIETYGIPPVKDEDYSIGFPFLRR